MNRRTRILTLAALAATLGACKHTGDLVVDEGVGVSAVRGTCPGAGIPDYTGDITTFRAPGASSAQDIDVVAAMTGLRAECTDTADKTYARVTFRVLARRSDPHGARDVSLPFFVSVVRGGGAVISKRVAQVTLHFADGQDRATADGVGGAYVSKAEASLPRDIRERILRKRKAGDADAAVDPMADPAVKAAITRSTFDVLVGFQLTGDQLTYNATR